MEKPNPSLTVVMTGGTSGLGAEAVRFMAARPNTRVLVGARGDRHDLPADVEIVPLDLASLASVRSFAEAIVARTGSGIDILVLNAGRQAVGGYRKSSDGYELTFAVNHLAHYLLVRLLTPHMAEGGRIVITTSDTHDPAVTPMGPRTLDPQALAYPREGESVGIRTYAASKLCNIMTALYLAQTAEVRGRAVEVVAFNPGLTGGTSLGREATPMQRFIVSTLMHTIFRVVGLFKPEYTIGTAERSGELLADVALGKVTFPSGRIYVSLVRGQPTFPDPSMLARDTAAQQDLWRQSSVMVGMSTED